MRVGNHFVIKGLILSYDAKFAYFKNTGGFATITLEGESPERTI